MPETKTTFCRICEAVCGMNVEVENGKVIDIKPDPNHPVSQGYSCVKGTKGMLAVQNDPDRVRYPLKRHGKGWKRISWDQAIREIGAKVRELRDEHGPRSVAAYFGNPSAFSYSHGAALRALMRTVGSPNIYSAGSQDCNGKFVASRLMFGSSLIQPAPDIDKTNFLLMLGANPLVSHFSFVTVPRPYERLKAIVDRGGRVVSVNPRRTETAKRVGEHLFIRPDTDLFFLLALLNVIFAEGLHNEPYLKRHTRGWEKLRELASAYTPEAAAPATGIPAEKTREIARAFAAADGAAAYTRTGTCIGHFGTLTECAVHWLNLATGNLDRSGGAFSGPGLLPLPRLAARMTRVDESRARSRIGNHPQVLGTFPAAILADEILTPGEGQVRALISSAGNPLLSCPGGEKLEKALGELELLVSADIYINETATFAHYVLPTTTFLEREDIFLPATEFQPIPFAQWTDAVATTDGEQKPEWWIYQRLAEATGLPIAGSSLADAAYKGLRSLGGLPLVGQAFEPTPERALDMTLRLFGRKSLQELKRNPHGLLLGERKYGEFLRRGVLTTSGRVRLVTPEIEKDLERAAAFFRELSGNGHSGLLLIGLREMRSHNSWLHNVPGFAGEGCVAHLNPADAAPRSIGEGTVIRVEGPGGKIETVAHLTEEIMPGTVAIPHGWGHTYPTGQKTARKAPGACTNFLVSDQEVEPMAGMSVLNGVRVEVIPVAVKPGQ